MNKGTRVTVIFVVTATIVGGALGFFSAYLETHGEQAIPQSNQLMMSLGAAMVVSSIAAARGGNRRIARAAADDDAEAKRWAPVADRATVYVFRDAFLGREAGLDVLVDGTPIGQTRSKTFYRLQLAPGEHLLTSRNPQNGSQNEYRLHAGAGSLHFLEQRVSFGMATFRHELVPAEQTAATPRIQRCRLLVRTAASERSSAAASDAGRLGA